MTHDALVTDAGVMESVNAIANICLRRQREWEHPANLGRVSVYYGAGSYAAPNPLCAAASFGYEHALRFMLENGALVNGIPALNYVGNPLIRALRHGNKTIVRILTDFGANINVLIRSRVYSLPILAAAVHSSELMKYVLDDYEVDTNLPDAFGRTVVSRHPKRTYVTMLIHL